MSECVLLMTGTEVSHDPGILASVGNFISYVQTYGNDNMLPVLTG